ncbi:MAG TPA: Spy/CpxP family protein refolding chaperone [Xanthobacteraceae bacterium]
MADQSNPASSRPSPSRGRNTVFVFALLAVAVVAGLTGNMLTTAFGQGMPWQAWHDGPFSGGPLTQAQIDDRIDRATKHLAIELDASADQQMKIAGIAKTAVGDLLPLRDRAQAARGQAVALLTAPTIDRSAIERLRTEQIALAETASKRIVQAMADASEVLTPDQRRKVADWITFVNAGPFWARWHRG